MFQLSKCLSKTKITMLNPREGLAARNTCVNILKVLVHTIQKIKPMLKFSISRSNKVKVTKEKKGPHRNLVTRSTRAYLLNHHSKVIAKVQSFW
jgi:hypothetical protein